MIFLLAELLFSVSLTTQYDSVPAEVPYNTFQLRCEASLPDDLVTPSFNIQWIRETGPAEQTMVTADSTTTITTSDTEPLSVLTTTQAMPGQYVYYCVVDYLYDGETVASAESNYESVTVRGKKVNT